MYIEQIVPICDWVLDAWDHFVLTRNSVTVIVLPQGIGICHTFFMSNFHVSHIPVCMWRLGGVRIRYPLSLHVSNMIYATILEIKIHCPYICTIDHKPV